MDILEISKDDIIIPKKFIKNELNSDLWIKEGKDYKLKPEVRKKLLQIANQFYDYLEIESKCEDIYFIGSMASYNWTNNSDIDLHLVFDYKKINKNVSLIEKYFDIKKKYWNDSHDIKIYGVDVELGCQDKEAIFYSKAVFSIKDNKWLNFPDKEKFSIDKNLLKNKILKIANQIEDLELINNVEDLLSKSKKIKDKIKKMRKSGLEKEGEYSNENLAFKYLRNNGYLSKLFDLKRKAEDQILSLKK